VNFLVQQTCSLSAKNYTKKRNHFHVVKERNEEPVKPEGRIIARKNDWNEIGLSSRQKFLFSLCQPNRLKSTNFKNSCMFLKLMLKSEGLISNLYQNKLDINPSDL
jgi:hypothetical protein